MSRAERRAERVADAAAVFCALGDDTRLSLVTTLADGIARTATQLAGGAPISRQAVMKHLKVLEAARLVRRVPEGRAVLYGLDVERIDDAGAFLHGISAGWDRAIARLRRLVEDERDP